TWRGTRCAVGVKLERLYTTSDGTSASRNLDNLFRRYWRISSTMTNRQGVIKRTWRLDVTIPPILGAAIGFIISIPGPEEKSMGSNEKIMAATVMSLGRSLEAEPSITASMYD